MSPLALSDLQVSERPVCKICAQVSGRDQAFHPVSWVSKQKERVHRVRFTWRAYRRFTLGCFALLLAPPQTPETVYIQMAASGSDVGSKGNSACPSMIYTPPAHEPHHEAGCAYSVVRISCHLDTAQQLLQDLATGKADIASCRRLLLLDGTSGALVWQHLLQQLEKTCTQ